MTAILVTRAGRGSVFSFRTVLSADAHPVCQHGDPIMTRVDHLRQSMTMEELAMVAEKIHDEGLGAQLRRFADQPTEQVRGLLESLWDKLERFAPSPPTDPAEMVKIIVADKIATRHTGIILRPRGDFEMTKHEHAHEHAHEAETQTETTNAATEGDAPKKVRPIPKDPKYADASIISMAKDKDGKPYGADNNPKKPSSASATRFALYKDGMTVREARDAGLQNGDFDNDVKKGFITIS